MAIRTNVRGTYCSADGYPAVWQSTPGAGRRLASSLSVVSAYPGLTALTKAQDMNVMSGSSQVLAVAADPHGFVSAGASSAVLKQIAINGIAWWLWPPDQGGQRRAVRRTIL